MRSYKNIILGIITFVVIMICAGSVNASAATLSLSQLRTKFPAGKYWNHAGNPGSSGSKNNQDGVTNVPCPRHGTVGTANQTCNGFAPYGGQLSWQCMGYAEKLGYDSTGYNPRENAGGWNTIRSSSALDSLKAGDIVRYKGDWHSIFVTGVSGETVTYTDCNSDGHCIIRWDQRISKSELRSSFTHVRSAPRELKNDSSGSSVNLTADTRYPTPFKCYPANNTSNTSVYYSNGDVESGRYISPGDECTINQVYTNGLCDITYPSGSSYRNAYAKLSDFITNGVNPYDWSPSHNVNSYKLSNRAEVFGSVFSTDSCKVVGGAGDLLQIIYPVSSGYKLGWVEVEKTYIPPIANVIPGPVVAGFFNGKEVVVMSPKRIDLGGSYYIAEGDICIIRSVNASNGYCTVTYPSGGNNVFTNYRSLKDATVPVSELIGYNPEYEYQKVTAQTTYAVYPTAAMTSTVAGSVTVNWTLDTGDVFYTINKSGDNTEVMYYCNRGTHEGYWKIGWINIPYYAIDVNANVDGSNYSDLTGYAYADVKINGFLLADNITDYWHLYPCGTTYEIDDIQTCNGYTYQGKNNISGVITHDTDIRLVFKKDPVKCTGIVVKSNPTKLIYKEDEEFDTTGLKVVAGYSDGSEKDVTSSCKISGYDGKPGIKTVNLSYSDFSSALTVTVTAKKPKTISVESYPEKTDYYIGEELDTKGLKVKVTYDNNTTAYVSDYDLVYDYSSWDTEGKKKIGVVYDHNNSEVLTSFEINVIKKYQNPPKLSIPSITCDAGSSFRVDMNITNNPGIASLKLNIGYDENILKLEKIEYNSEWGGMTRQPQKLTSPVILNWFNGTENYTGDSRFATLYFTAIRQNEQIKTTSLNITYDEEDVYNINEKNTGLDIENNKITIDSRTVVATPTLTPTDTPQPVPICNSPTPTAIPTQAPTQEPTRTPTQVPTAQPTQVSTASPTQVPTASPTQNPTQAPTQVPTQIPTQEPTQEPTQNPTQAPTQVPTQELTELPTQAPTQVPTVIPTQVPQEFTTGQSTITLKPNDTTGMEAGTDNNTDSGHVQLPSVTQEPVTEMIDLYDTSAGELRKMSIVSIAYKKNVRLIKGKLSVKNATVKIKIGNRKYKKAKVTGRNFTLRYVGKISKNTKVIIKAKKFGYKSFQAYYIIR